MAVVELIPIGECFSDEEYPNCKRQKVELRLNQSTYSGGCDFCGSFYFIIENDLDEEVITIGSEKSVTLDELNELTEITRNKGKMGVSISMDGIGATLNLTSRNGNLWINLDLSEENGISFDLKIEKPVNFLESLCHQLSCRASYDDE